MRGCFCMPLIGLADCSKPFRTLLCFSVLILNGVENCDNRTCPASDNCIASSRSNYLVFLRSHLCHFPFSYSPFTVTICPPTLLEGGTPSGRQVSHTIKSLKRLVNRRFVSRLGNNGYHASIVEIRSPLRMSAASYRPLRITPM